MAVRSIAADTDLGAIDDPGLPAGAEMVNDFCQGPQSDTGADGAPTLGERWPHLADGAGDRGAVHAEPARQYAMRGPVTEMHEGGQEPVDERQSVLRAGTHASLPRLGRHPGLVAFMP
ncbi:hypothetical protein GCM10022245_51780 [Streptomyces mayteni]